LNEPRPAWGSDGLAPGIVQDAGDGRVLMLGWLDAEALAATVTTGLVHFHSRSRGRLWRKGEASGNELSLEGLALDCDGDALLLTVSAAGPTCHTGSRSCFDAGEPVTSWPQSERPAQGFAWLEQLWRTIEDRATTRPADSYTTRLLDGGVDQVGRKIAEEATEVLIAAKDDAAAEDAGQDRDVLRTALAGELADLVYHSLVLCLERSVPPAEVLGILRARAGAHPGR